VVAVIGPNGCGKSTLLDIVCGLLKPDSGRSSGEPAALMPQQELLMPWAGALDNAALALRSSGVSRTEARARAAEWFETLGLSGFEQARPHELSGGMRQRVAFARTLLSGRPLLALDEPFSALDSLTRIEARTWLQRTLETSGRTALIVTHDVREAVALSSKVVVLSARPASVIGEFEVPVATATDPAAAALLEQRILERLVA
jgi:NitT/TauT family transport system ATP-binding protein